MKSSVFLFLAFFASIGFSSCSGTDSKEPEPAEKKTFTGCRLIKTINMPDAAQPERYETEYIYDANNNIIEERGSFNGTYKATGTYTYNAAGKIIALNAHLVSGDHFSRTYQYNAAGQLIVMEEAGGRSRTAYHYNAAGMADSSWKGLVINGVFEPQWVSAYAYQANGALKKTTSFHIANGKTDSLPGVIEEHVSFDNFTNPLTLASFNVRQLSPPFLLTKNNVTHSVSTDYSGPTPVATVHTFTNKYNADGLLIESVLAGSRGTYHYGGTQQFVYDCN